MGGLQYSESGIRGLRLDPRTKLLLTITVGVVTVMGGNTPVIQAAQLVLMLAPAALMLLAGRVRQAAVCLGAYAACSLAVRFLVPLTHGALNLLLSATCVVFTRFLPGVMAAWYMLSTTTVSEFMAAMQRMRLSDKITIPLSVVFRFAPTVREEFASINDAMRMRGVQFGGGKPGAMLEYRLVPMLMCSVKIGEELSAAALTRGLGAPVRRTHIFRVGFGPVDIVLLFICLTALVLLVLNRLGVF